MDIVTGNGEKNLTLKNCTYKTTRGKSDIIARIRAKKFGVKNYVNRVSRVEPLHASDSRNRICHFEFCTPSALWGTPSAL